MFAMPDEGAVFTKARICIGILAILILGVTLSPGRASAQAAPGPQSGATPSDEPLPPPKPRAVPQIGGHPSFAGNWTLNQDQSDDARAKIREAMGNSSNQSGNQSGG